MPLLTNFYDCFDSKPVSQRLIIVTIFGSRQIKSELINLTKLIGNDPNRHRLTANNVKLTTS